MGRKVLAVPKIKAGALISQLGQITETRFEITTVLSEAGATGIYRIIATPNQELVVSIVLGR